MKVLFRVDASFDIGNGHVMRCLTLASALAAQGADCTFVCREHAGNLIEHIRTHGFVCHGLPNGRVASQVRAGNGTMKTDWLGADWTIDAEQTYSMLAGGTVDWIVVDHYSIGEGWEKHMRRACGALMVIDDLADRFHDCDLLLNQNLGRSTADYRFHTPEDCQLLVGSEYALLRPDFAVLRKHSLERRIQPSLREIMVFMGGVDKDNITGKFLDALVVCRLPSDCRITVVMGPNAPLVKQVQIQAARMPWPTSVRINVPDMARLMASSDLAIGAAGSTSWERCALGLPSLLVIIADNQREAAEALSKMGAANVIESGTDLPATLQMNLDQFLSDGSSLRLLSERAAAICDGQGTLRVLSRMLNRDLAQEPL